MRGQKLHLAISPCPNDTFMFDAIINRRIDLGGLDVDVEYLDIEQLNVRALSRSADVTKCSAALLSAIVDNYRLLDSGAALGRGNGPLLVRRCGDRTPIRHIAVPGLNTTANALVARLFPDIEHRTPLLFSEIAEAVERGDYDGGMVAGVAAVARTLSDGGEIFAEEEEFPTEILGVIAMFIAFFVAIIAVVLIYEWHKSKCPKCGKDIVLKKTKKDIITFLTRKRAIPLTTDWSA